MLNLSKRIWAPLLVVAVCLVSAQAQQQQQPPPANPPAQPTTPVQPITNPDNKQQGTNDEPASPLQQAATVVTGGIAPTAGETNEAGSQVLFGFQAAESFDSNYLGTAIPGAWNDITSFGGHVDLHRIGPTSDLLFRYAGGGAFDPQNSSLNTMYHQFEAAETLQFRRWSLRFDDLFSYLPSSSFGFQMFGITQPNLSTNGLLNPSIPPSQSILTTQEMRLSNVILTQVQIEASERTAFTFTAGYGLLHM